MRERLSRRAATIGLVATGVLTLLPALRAHAQCMLTVGWEPYAPYSFVDTAGTVTGIDIEMVRAIATEIGCGVRFRELPWARILLEVENGMIDAATSTSFTPERADWGLFSVPYRRAEMALFVRQNDSARYPLGSLSDILDSGLRLGYIVGYFYGEEFERLQRHPRFAELADGTTTYADNIRKLLNRRIDVYLVEDVGVMAAEVAALGFAGEVERHPMSLPGDDLHLLFSRRTISPDLVAAVDSMVMRMRSDGRLDQIIERFNHPRN
jgi:polar amino acid transport system substrate-binding protein